VGREHDVRKRQQRIAGLERLVVEDVEAGGRHLAVGEGVEERVPLDERAAARVDQDRRPLHEGELAT